MSCYFPLTAYRRRDYGSDNAFKIVFSMRDGNLPGKLFLPCGQCIGCRLERSRQWAVRCMHEASLYDKNCFLTLTYDDVHLPRDLSLDLSHFQLFMKRLRKEYGPGIRYFHCGEYGEQFGRPHYHALLFNHDFPDRKFFKGAGDSRLYSSDSLSRLWPYGFSLIGEVTFESAAYVARYIMKKVTGERSAEHYGGRRPEYTTMSRRPGIGKDWFDRFSGDVVHRDGVIVNGHKTRVPRYYDGLWLRADRSSFELAKLKRSENEKFVTDYFDGKKIFVSDSSLGRLSVKEVVKQAEISTLRRSLE